jgi:hypothetical protein
MAPLFPDAGFEALKVFLSPSVDMKTAAPYTERPRAKAGYLLRNPKDAILIQARV